MIFKPNKIKHNLIEGKHEYSITMKIRLPERDDSKAEQVFIKELFYPELKNDKPKQNDTFDFLKGFGHD